MLISENTIRKIIKENLLNSLLIEAASLSDFRKKKELYIGEYSPIEIIEKKLNNELKNLLDDLEEKEREEKEKSLQKEYGITWDPNSIARYFSEILLDLFKEMSNTEENENEKILTVNNCIEILIDLFSKRNRSDYFDEENNIKIKDVVLFLKDKNTNSKLYEMYKNMPVLKKLLAIQQNTNPVISNSLRLEDILNDRKKIIDQETYYIVGKEIYEGYKIVMPTTTRSSVFWARTNWKSEKIVLPKDNDISWCTARYDGKNMFSNYFDYGSTNLFYFLPEGDVEGNKKFCIGVSKLSKSGKDFLICSQHTNVDFNNDFIFKDEQSKNFDEKTKKEISSRFNIRNPTIFIKIEEKMKEKEIFDKYKNIAGLTFDQFKSLTSIRRNERGYAKNSEEVSQQIQSVLQVYNDPEYLQKKYEYNQKILNHISRNIFKKDEKGVPDFENSWFGPRTNIEINRELFLAFFKKETEEYLNYSPIKLINDFERIENGIEIFPNIEVEEISIKEKDIIDFILNEGEYKKFINKMQSDKRSSEYSRFLFIYEKYQKNDETRINVFRAIADEKIHKLLLSKLGNNLLEYLLRIDLKNSNNYKINIFDNIHSDFIDIKKLSRLILQKKFSIYENFQTTSEEERLFSYFCKVFSVSEYSNQENQADIFLEIIKEHQISLMNLINLDEVKNEKIKKVLKFLKFSKNIEKEITFNINNKNNILDILIEKNIFKYLPEEYLNFKEYLSLVFNNKENNSNLISFCLNFILSDISLIDENSIIFIEFFKKMHSAFQNQLKDFINKNIDITFIKNKKILELISSLQKASIIEDDIQEFQNSIKNRSIFQNFKILKKLFSKGINHFNEILKRSNISNEEIRRFMNGGIVIDIVKHCSENLEDNNFEFLNTIDYILRQIKIENIDIWKVSEDRGFGHGIETIKSNKGKNLFFNILAYYFPDLEKASKYISQDYETFKKYVFKYYPEKNKKTIPQKMISKFKNLFGIENNEEKDIEQREKEFFEENRKRKNIFMTERQLRQFIRKNLN